MWDQFFAVSKQKSVLIFFHEFRQTAKKARQELLVGVNWSANYKMMSNI